MKKHLIAAALSLTTALTLQAQSVRFVTTAGGNSNVSLVRAVDAIKGMAEDGNNNTYVIGNYTGTIAFIKYPNTTATGLAAGIPSISSHTSAGSQDIFLARYDVNGKCTWSASIGGAGFDEGNAICFNGNAANPTEFFITGMFNGQMNIGANTLDAVASGYAVNDAFIIRYTTSYATAPTASWWRSFGGGSETCGLGIAASGSSVFVTGYFTDFCMDANGNMVLEKMTTAGVTGSSFSTTTPGYLEFPGRDMFVVRFSTSGFYNSALCTAGSQDQVEGHGIALYGSYLYVVGTYKGTIRFSSSATTPCTGQSDIFVARYPMSFSATPGTAFYPTAAVTAGGPSNLYQASVGQPFYKPDNGSAITVNPEGVFVTGRFIDQITFNATTYNPAGITSRAHMFLARYDHVLTNTPLVVTGADDYNEGQSIYAVSSLGTSTIFVAGAGMSNSSVNGSPVETNSYTPENCGFVARIAYNSSGPSFTNGFVDGIAQNTNALMGTGTNGIVNGYAVTSRGSCGVGVAGNFSAQTYFGNYLKALSGVHDAYFLVRENDVTVTPNQLTCGSGIVTLTGSYAGPGTPSYVWSSPSGVVGTTPSVNVTPPANVNTTYTFTVSGTGTCPVAAPVTIYNYPMSQAHAGPDRVVCPSTPNTTIGTAATGGYTYSWAPATGLSSTLIAQPTASPTVTTTYTLIVTDKCGAQTADLVTVTRAPACLHRLASPGSDEPSSALAIYPNPGSGVYTITSGSDLAKDILVYDMMGKLVSATYQVTGTTASVDISASPKGVYFVQVITGGNIETQRIVNQ
jgi:hypothetical protein